jgi:hypothetical protein
MSLILQTMLSSYLREALIFTASATDYPFSIKNTVEETERMKLGVQFPPPQPAIRHTPGNSSCEERKPGNDPAMYL